MYKFNKHFYSLNEYLKNTFRQKIYKISLSSGLSCPNRDGKIDTRGCIFCSKGGSGEFAEDYNLSICEQIDRAKRRVKNKIKDGKYIAYFQSYTNTYADESYLERIFLDAINSDDIVALSIATRPDCLEDSILNLIEKLNRIKPVWIEFGLQTMHESTANYIRRGYDLNCFESSLYKLKNINVDVIVHLIFGLPGETFDNMLETVEYVSSLPIDGVKFQLLNVLRGTDLEKEYNKGLFNVLSMEEYINILFESIMHLRRDIVIHRITGDGPRSILIAPLWHVNKRKVLNTINFELKNRNVYQGSKFMKNKKYPSK